MLTMYLSKPVYESLPYMYMALGVGALGASYAYGLAVWSDVLLLSGFVALVLGLVVALKRRDYRIQKRRYGSQFDDDD
jgi:hypothetical protein